MASETSAAHAFKEGNYRSSRPPTVTGETKTGAALNAGELLPPIDPGYCKIEIHFGDAVRRLDYRFIEMNAAFEFHTGLTNAVGRWMRDLAPNHEEYWFEQYASVARTGVSMRFTQQALALGGRHYEVNAFRVGDPNSRQVAILFTDTTNKEKSLKRRDALLELSDRIGRVDNIAEMAFISAEITGLTLGATCAGYGTMDADIETTTVERDWAAPGVTSIVGTYRLRTFGSYLDDLRRGATVIVSDVRQDARTARSSSMMEAIGCRAFVNLPIMEHDRMVAVFFVLSSAPRQWSEQEIEFIRYVALRTRSAIERRRAEMSLLELTAALEGQVAERTRDRNRLWKLSGDLMLVAAFDGLIRDINPAWQAILGWSFDQLAGESFVDLVHPDDLDQTMKAAGDIKDTGRSLMRFENRYRHADGSYRWVSWTAGPAEDSIIAVGRDITDEKEKALALAQAESALRQSQKMEAVGQLTGGLAHDFNNLLAGIMGNLELLQRRVANGRLEDLGRYLDAAQGASRRAAALTQRLLAFSRRQTLDPKPIDVNRLITGLQDLLLRTVGATAAIEVVGAAGLWTVNIDASQLENSLLNLCINGRDAMPQGGRLTITTANHRIDERTARRREMRPGHYVSVCVSDTGSGMTADTIQRAFEPFFTTKPIGQGTGLGLSMIYGFAQQSGGQVRIASELGKGSTVCIYLPRFHGEAVDASAPEQTAMPEPGGMQTVLLVEDEATIRQLIGEVLEELGYTVVEAADGAAGLKVLQSGARIQLLVTDVGLPNGMNGRQVADAARVLLPDLGVLFITGFAEAAALGHGQLDAGMELLTKPFTLEALAAKVADMLKRR